MAHAVRLQMMIIKTHVCGQPSLLCDDHQTKSFFLILWEATIMRFVRCFPLFLGFFCSPHGYFGTAALNQSNCSFFLLHQSIDYLRSLLQFRNTAPLLPLPTASSGTPARSSLCFSVHWKDPWKALQLSGKGRPAEGCRKRIADGFSSNFQLWVSAFCFMCLTLRAAVNHVEALWPQWGIFCPQACWFFAEITKQLMLLKQNSKALMLQHQLPDDFIHSCSCHL